MDEVGRINTILIRQITSDDWELYKDIRLRSLNESPHAFGSTFEEESLFSNERWRERVSVNERVAIALPLIAEFGDKCVGIACGVVHSLDDEYGKIYQMWVEPAHRGNGVGKLLLRRIIDWAKDRNLRGLKLAATTSNTPATALYQSIGFVVFGELEPLRPGSKLTTQNMKLEFGGDGEGLSFV